MKRLETFAEAWAAIPRPSCPLCQQNECGNPEIVSIKRDPRYGCLDGCTLTITKMSNPYWTIDCTCYECGHEWIAPLEAEIGERIFAAYKELNKV